MLQCPQVQVYFFMCMCVAMMCIMAHMDSFGGLFHFSCSVVVFILCFLRLPCEKVAGHVPQVLPYGYGTSRGQRLQVKGHGGVSSTFKCIHLYLHSRRQAGPLGKFSAYIRIHTAGKLGLDVTSVPGSSLQLSYIKREMADINSATCTTAYKLLVPLQLSLYTRCLVPSLLEVQ